MIRKKWYSISSEATVHFSHSCAVCVPLCLYVQVCRCSAPTRGTQTCLRHNLLLNYCCIPDNWKLLLKDFALSPHKMLGHHERNSCICIRSCLKKVQSCHHTCTVLCHPLTGGRAYPLDNSWYNAVAERTCFQNHIHFDSVSCDLANDSKFLPEKWDDTWNADARSPSQVQVWGACLGCISAPSKATCRHELHTSVWFSGPEENLRDPQQCP